MNRPRPWGWRGGAAHHPRRLTLGAWLSLVLLTASGCSCLPDTRSAPSGPAAAPASVREREPETQATPEQTCSRWYAALDAATQADGVRDAADARVEGFPHLRMNRFLASWRDLLATDGMADAGATERHALVNQLARLDLQARRFELANLAPASHQTLAAIAGMAPGEAGLAPLLQRTRACSGHLIAADLRNPGRLEALRQRLAVPDSYSDTYRVLGLYPLSRLPFSQGVRRFEAQRRGMFAGEHQGSAASQPPPNPRLRLSPSTGARAGAAPPSEETIATAASSDALPWPTPSAQQVAELFERHAPVFDIEAASADDLPGALAWRASMDGQGRPESHVDPGEPTVYRRLAHTRHGGHTLLQLVYSLWFPARTAEPGKRWDLLAGKLDGLVWRVTLAPDGTPLVYDTMHPCGCYHMFFPTPAAHAKPAPDAQTEWAFIPKTLQHLEDGERWVLRLAAGTHYLDGVEKGRAEQQRPPGPAQRAVAYAWRDDDELRSLPFPPQGTPPRRRSLFGPDGFVAGTDRAEAWLFWPMGIRRAGAMRQWGHHATAFVGRRHFDDAHLMEQRFEFDAVHFARQRRPSAVNPGP